MMFPASAVRVGTGPNHGAQEEGCNHLGQNRRRDGDGDLEQEAIESLPSSRPAHLVDGESWRVAVKIIDPRGNEGLRVLTVWG